MALFGTSCLEQRSVRDKCLKAHVCVEVRYDTEARASASRRERAATAPLRWTVDPGETCSAPDSYQNVTSQEFLARRGPARGGGATV